MFCCIRGVQEAMNARLQAAVAAAEQLSDDAQAEIAAIMEQEIADLAWKQSLNDPRSQAVLDQLEAQLDEEIIAGEIYDWPTDEKSQNHIDYPLGPNIL